MTKMPYRVRSYNLIRRLRQDTFMGEIKGERVRERAATLMRSSTSPTVWNLDISSSRVDYRFLYALLGPLLELVRNSENLCLALTCDQKHARVVDWSLAWKPGTTLPLTQGSIAEAITSQRHFITIAIRSPELHFEYPGLSTQDTALLSVLKWSESEASVDADRASVSCNLTAARATRAIEELAARRLLLGLNDLDTYVAVAYLMKSTSEQAGVES